MDGIRGAGVALTAVVVALVSAWPAHAAEGTVGSAARAGTSQFDAVPALRVGSRAPGAATENGELFLVTRGRRCPAVGYVGAVLLPRPIRYGRPAGRSRVRVRGTGPASLRATVRRRYLGGVDPTAIVVFSARLPPEIAPEEPRRFLTLSLALRAEDEGCGRSVSRVAPRLARSLYLRGIPARRLAPMHSPTRRIDGGAPTRLGGAEPSAGLGSQIDSAGDLDGDGHEELLVQEREESGTDWRRRGLVRFGGRPGLLDAAGLGSGGFALTGGTEAPLDGAAFAPAGSFLGGSAAALAAAIEGPRTSNFIPLPGRGVIAVIMPGRRYTGYVDPRRAPPGSVQITAPRGCADFPPSVSRVGDVNGDGRDDLFVARPEQCRPDLAGIVFGGSAGPVALDALGTRGIQLDPRELNGQLAVPAGDVNGDGFDDFAFTGDDLDETQRDEVAIVLGRAGAGTRSVRRGPGMVRISRRGCRDLGEVQSAGDLDGDGADELVIAVDDCDDRTLGPDVAHVLRGRRALPARLVLGPTTGLTVRSRFGPLAAPRVAAGRDVSGGPGADVALGFAGGGPDGEGETWILRDVGASGTLTLGALGPAGVRLLGGRGETAFGSDVAFVGERGRSQRADLVVGAKDADFAGRTEAGTIYTYAAGAAPAPSCRLGANGAGRVWGTDLGDVLTGSPGPDRMIGFEGGDCLRGEAGADRLIGDPGSDRLEGGAGPDRLAGGAGRDVLLGGPGPDHLDGGPRGDRLDGGAGADRIDAGGGAGDRVFAGAGDDVVRSSDRGLDVIDCGPGRDVAVADPGDRLRGCERVRRVSVPVYDD